MQDVKSIIEQWNADEPMLRKLGEAVSAFIKEGIAEYEILPEIQFRTKELVSIIKKIKKKNENKQYSYDDLTDKLGLRIICDLQHELDAIEEFIKEKFHVVCFDNKRDNLDFKTLGYISNHYDVKINKDVEQFKELGDITDYVFEIQVRTLSQHAWSNAAHRLSYKQSHELDPYLQRRIYRLSSLFEIADDEFLDVYNRITSHNDNTSIALLDKIEGSFFKFAKMNYDRELSIETIDRLTSLLVENAQSNENDKLKKNVVSFIQGNEQKIRQIYKDKSRRFHEVLLLTQPEIFLIWYMLENFSCILDDNWDDYFDSEDLTMAKTLWGKKFE